MLIESYIDGGLVEGKSYFANVNLASGDIICRVLEAGKLDAVVRFWC